ncbi:hypothetical protein FHR81_002550 [Actinoalloteichus hoggarensis]|uniref:Uncharacterized protein n=1 Tax=Actinoalloteichus hoggarensis TaxID=1470176 RepID=A0A221VXC2_9PSEU|nr:DUF3592 domain-containing protein [Actinoalloteichus hoggarensis]ASO18154.1 hypothetical protein AHOG_02450 [Actinoalloteichus hoggarensis]MBB5921510.1 hypothetical protein [Actinoalloteichus hoggarensis]
MLLGLGVLVTLMSVLLVSGARVSDARIEADLGETTAEVLSVSLPRTLVRYNTPEGAVHSPQTGVLYPAGLSEQDLVRVEYDREEPDLVRVAGRDFTLTLLPVSLVLVSTWAVLLTTVWLVCRSRRAAASAADRSDAPPAG